MTPALRKYHRIFWYVAACILPVLFVAAILSIPPAATNPGVDGYTEDRLPVLIRKSQTEQFEISLRSSDDGGASQIEILPLKSLRIPEALVYIIPSAEGQVTDGILLGRLLPGAPCRFALPAGLLQDVYHIRIRNPYDQSTITATAF